MLPNDSVTTSALPMASATPMLNGSEPLVTNTTRPPFNICSQYPIGSKLLRNGTLNPPPCFPEPPPPPPFSDPNHVKLRAIEALLRRPWMSRRPVTDIAPTPRQLGSP